MSVVDDYARSLNELTFNSQPIIKTLTDIAGENVGVAEGIANAIFNRILKSIPEQKLFALYLLDSVCKTIGSPYSDIAGSQVFNLFSHVYMLVGDAVRQKLVKLFITWKQTTTRDGQPLFPHSQLDRIEQFLQKAGRNINNAGGESAISNSSVIADIRTLIPIFENKLINNPDPQLSGRYEALKLLEALLQSQPMNAQELQAVQVQLATMKLQELSGLNTPVVTPASTAVATPSVTPASTPGLPQALLVLSQNKRANDLFSVLIASGLVKVEQSLKPGSVPKYELVFPATKYEPRKKTQMTNNALEQLLSSANSNIVRSAYDQLKFNELLHLPIDSKSPPKELQDFINTKKVSTKTLALLYDAKPSQCSSCGKRFSTDDMGKNRKRMHLDWHFRINKKLATRSNVQSRNWYLDDVDWVKFKEDDLLEYTSNDQKAIAAAPPVPTKNEPVPYVVVPPYETNMNNKCLICHEPVNAVQNEDIGEWCWYNCIRAPGEPKTSRKIVHATCFNETKRKAGDDIGPAAKRERV